jgi:general L-amino acid transport system permease protein
VLGLPIIAWILLYGGVLGLPAVPTEFWGGLMVTLVVATVGIAGSLPIGIVLALGRRSAMPIARWASIFFIEVVRAVPLITILFMSSVMLPLFLPEGVSFDKLLRALIGVMLFSGAYMAETIRGGLQAIPKGQYEAADALGLSFGQKMGLIVLPQALKLVIPGIVNSFVGLAKDTSLVLIIGIFDLLGIVQAGLTDAKWFAPNTAMTGYAFAAIIFWIICFSISRYSAWLERRLSRGERR